MEDQKTGALRLLLAPEEYLKIIGFSLQNHLLSPEVRVPGGNEAEHRIWRRWKKSGSLTEHAATRIRAAVAAKLDKTIPLPDEVELEKWRQGPQAEKFGRMGEWFHWSCLLKDFAPKPDFAPETAGLIEDLATASESLNRIAKEKGPKHFAKELRRHEDPDLKMILEASARAVETSNSGEYRSAMAPVHVFSCAVLVLGFLAEREGDRAEAVRKINLLLHGEKERAGPKLALARWLEIVKREMGFRTNQELFEALDPDLDENARIEWQKILAGKRMPPISNLDSALLRCRERLPMKNSLFHGLENCLWYHAFVARSVAYLDKHGHSDWAEEIFSRAGSFMVRHLEASG